MTYKGWKLTNTITFVKNKRRNMSYIVDPDNQTVSTTRTISCNGR